MLFRVQKRKNGPVILQPLLILTLMRARYRGL